MYKENITGETVINDNIEIVNRFFQSLHKLKAEKVIRGISTFTQRYGINRLNLFTLEKEPARGIFKVAWLLYLVRDYKVSPLYLITGNGDFWIDGWNAEKVTLKLSEEQEKNEDFRKKRVQITGK